MGRLMDVWVGRLMDGWIQILKKRNGFIDDWTKRYVDKYLVFLSTSTSHDGEKTLIVLEVDEQCKIVHLKEVQITYELDNLNILC